MLEVMRRKPPLRLVARNLVTMGDVVAEPLAPGEGMARAELATSPSYAMPE